VPLVLYVDDSPVAQAVVAKRLEQRGLQVVMASTVEEAGLLDASTYGAALLDLEVGKGCGADLAAGLRGARPHLPVAFLTSATEGGALDRARALGPVFEKSSELDGAVEWVAGQAGIE